MHLRVKNNRNKVEKNPIVFFVWIFFFPEYCFSCLFLNAFQYLFLLYTINYFHFQPLLQCFTGVRWYASVRCIRQVRASLSTRVKAGAWPKYSTIIKDYLWPVTDLVQTVIRKWVKNLSLHTTTIIMSYWRGYVSIFQYFIQNNLVFCSYDHNIITVFRFVTLWSGRLNIFNLGLRGPILKFQMKLCPSTAILDFSFFLG